MINHQNKFGLRQRGGTVVGIVIGLIIGLAIALVVALAITKTSLPFLSKTGKQDKVPELTAGQAADPNKPLYGNNGAAKEAAKDFAPTTDAVPPAAPGVAATAANPAANPAVPPAALAPPANSKPGATAKTAEPAAKPDNADDKWMYYLQAGAFRDQADAENSKAKLALAGFEASISDRTSDTGPLYRVRIGPFNQLEAMNRVRGKLSDNGIDVAVVRIAK
jgi:cell division protein FtsN